MALSPGLAVELRKPLPAAPRWRHHLVGFGLVAPALALVLGMYVYPLLYEVQLSVTDSDASTASGKFVGLRNYAQVLADDAFWSAMRTTAFLSLLTATAAVVLGLTVALLLWRRSWLRPLLLVMVFLPWVYPSSFANYTFYWILLPPFHTFYTLDAIQARFWLEGLF